MTYESIGIAKTSTGASDDVLVGIEVIFNADEKEKERRNITLAAAEYTNAKVENLIFASSLSFYFAQEGMLCEGKKGNSDVFPTYSTFLLFLAFPNFPFLQHVT